MDGFDASSTATCNRGDGIEDVRRLRQPIVWSGLLAIATATAVLISGLNGLVQIVKAAIECSYWYRG